MINKEDSIDKIVNDSIDKIINDSISDKTPLTFMTDGNTISGGMSKFLADEIAKDILEKNTKYDLVDFVPSEDKIYPCTGCAIRDICDGTIRSNDSYIESLIYVCIEHENKTVILKEAKDE